MGPDLTPDQILQIMQDREDKMPYESIAKKNNTSAYYVKKTIKIYSGMDRQQIEDKIAEIGAILHVRWNRERNYKAEYQMYKERYTLKNKRRSPKFRKAEAEAKAAELLNSDINP